MQINPNLNINRFENTSAAKTGGSNKPQASTQETSSGSFAGASALESALGLVPDVRPEAVARAKQLIADPTYPSAQTLRRASDFLAKKLLTEDENSSNNP